MNTLTVGEYLLFLALIIVLVYLSAKMIVEFFDEKEINFDELINGIEKVHKQTLNLFSFRSEYNYPKFDALLLGRLTEKRAKSESPLLKKEIEEVLKDFDEYVLSASFTKGDK